MKLITFQNFSCYYKIKNQYILALDDISFNVEKGSFCVLLGESGCGKTTLLRSIAGQCDYVEGDLIVDGISVDNLNVSEISLSFVKQEFSLYPNLTIYENIAFPLRVNNTSEKEIRMRVEEIAKRFDILFLLSRKPHQLSIGQQQLVAIARAMIKRPYIMLFDEPFSNVDLSYRLKMIQIIKDYHQSSGATILFVTHDVDEAFMLSDDIIVLEKGKLIERGNYQKLKRNPISSLLKGYFKNER